MGSAPASTPSGPPPDPSSVAESPLAGLRRSADASRCVRSPPHQSPPHVGPRPGPALPSDAEGLPPEPQPSRYSHGSPHRASSGVPESPRSDAPVLSAAHRPPPPGARRAPDGLSLGSRV